MRFIKYQSIWIIEIKYELRQKSQSILFRISMKRYTNNDEKKNLRQMLISESFIGEKKQEKKEYTKNNKMR